MKSNILHVAGWIKGLLQKGMTLMAEVFSPNGTPLDANAVALDQAPAAPTLTQNDDGSFTLTCPTTDFDGTAMTPNPSLPGSTGCDNAYVCGTKVNADGSSALDNLGGADAVNGFKVFNGPASPGAAIIVPASIVPQIAGGGKFRLVPFVSDGQNA